MARQSPRILVSIVNWNSTDALKVCLAGIAKLPNDEQPDVAVVDNHSTRDEFKIEPDVQKSLRSLTISKNKQNLGFAGGHNPHIRWAKQEGYDYIFLLNPDTEIIDMKLFVKLIDALEHSPKALGANPTILRSVDPDIIWYGGGKLSLVTGYATHLRVGAQPEAASIRPVSLLTGGCLAIALRRAALEQLLLNEDYFVYWEDTDWCARAQKAGFQLLYVPKALLLHHVSSSLGIRSPTYIYYNIRNHFLFARRNMHPVYRPLAWLLIGWISAKYKLNILFRYRQAKFQSLKALWAAWLDGLSGRTGTTERNL
ncbi:MAG: glycosyltransferase family 2 protein [Candidatus Saccharimonadales bacterium]